MHTSKFCQPNFRIAPEAFNSDGWTGYNGLVDIGYGHYRVDHGRDEFVRDPNHIIGIDHAIKCDFATNNGLQCDF